jgi:uncharacterized C2H2 Zn-finger protein
MKLTANQIRKLKGETFLNCWSGGGLFKKMCINKLKEDYIKLSLKKILIKIKS